MKRRFKNPEGIPDYVTGPQFNPGANGFIFQREYLDPVLLFRGPGRVPRGHLSIFQQPQVLITARATERGLGGLVAGQMVMSPLITNGGS